MNINALLIVLGAVIIAAILTVVVIWLDQKQLNK